MAGLNLSARQLFWGNALLAVCCVFYLAWWVLAFRPTNPVKGFKTGWLLIPAFIAGVVAVFLSIYGVVNAKTQTRLFPNNAVLWGGIIVYLSLLFITFRVFRRPVTTELLLIVGWLMLAFVEVNTLLGLGLYSRPKAFAFIAISVIATIANLVCYVLYYNLSAPAGFYDGMVPLALVLLLTLGIDLGMVV